MRESEKYKLSTYRCIELLHKTALATVELAECSLDGKKYVKKTYHADKRNIFHSLLGISSPYLPKIYEVFFGEDTIVIEEFIEGHTLEELITSKHKFKRDEIAKIFENLLSALSMLHKNKIIHRDIKPSNIIIRENGQAVLIDFSIARPYVFNQSCDTEQYGTVGYAAPEQFGFSQSDYRTDIYALGITMKAIVGARSTPGFVRKAVMRCAEFDPANRFQSISEIQKYIKRKRRKPKIIIFITILIFVAVMVVLAPVLQRELCGEEKNSIFDFFTQDETLSPLIYAPNSSRIIETYNTNELVPCLQIWEEKTYQTRIKLAVNMPETFIKVVSSNGIINISLDDKTLFSFESTYSPTSYSYQDGKIIAEIIFYDMNEDGVLDIIPVMCDARIEQKSDNGEVSLLKNFSQAWCIYYNGEKYIQAEGDIIADSESLKIYASAPGGIGMDPNSAYILDGNGKLANT